MRPPPRSPLFPYTTLFRSHDREMPVGAAEIDDRADGHAALERDRDGGEVAADLQAMTRGRGSHPCSQYSLATNNSWAGNRVMTRAPLLVTTASSSMRAAEKPSD